MPSGAAPRAGLPSARLANARLRNGEPYGHDATIHVTTGESLQQVATEHGLNVMELIKLNEDEYPGINSRSKLLEGTSIQLAEPEAGDLDAHATHKDTPRSVAARCARPPPPSPAPLAALTRLAAAAAARSCRSTTWSPSTAAAGACG